MSFDAVAQAYASARPEWPAGTVAWLVGDRSGDQAPTGAGPGEPGGRAERTVLDLGAGTGLLSRTLAASGHRVISADVAPRMLAQVRHTVPDAQPVLARAEQLPLADRSVDAVTVAQAWHWFDHERAAWECARVLRPGGWLGVAWHVQDERDPWVRALQELVGRPGDAAVHTWGQMLRLPAPFAPAQRRLFHYQHRLTPDGLRVLAASWSYVAVRPDREQVLDAVQALGERTAGPDGLLTLRHLTRCYRARRGSG